MSGIVAIARDWIFLFFVCSTPLSDWGNHCLIVRFHSSIHDCSDPASGVIYHTVYYRTHSLSFCLIASRFRHKSPALDTSSPRKVMLE